MNKNDKVTLEITDITEDGNGIGHFDNMAVFVPNTAVGDIAETLIVKVNKTYAFGKALSFIKLSSDRIDVDCECFLKCGGCTLRHISYEKEKEIKENRVYECIKRIGKTDLKPEKICGAQTILRYRNKAQYPVGEGGEIGFYAPHSHRIIPINDCLLEPLPFSVATSIIKKWIKENGIEPYNGETKKGAVRHIYLRTSNDGDLMVVIVTNKENLNGTDALVSELKTEFGEKLKSVQLNINKKNNNVILGEKNIVLYGDSYITDTLLGIKVRITGNSFYQVNHDMAEKLYTAAQEYAEPENKTVLDLYCGTGTIGLTMAKKAKKIIGVEIVKSAVNDAVINAKENGINNAEFICADAKEAVITLKEKNEMPDVVILDPPRKGCDETVLKTVANGFSPERIVYVSCNPATLARDIKILGEYNYKLIKYKPFDLFPRTTHVETVALLIKNIK